MGFQSWKLKWVWQPQFFRHTLEIFKISSTLWDLQVILLSFFDISYGFKFRNFCQKSSVLSSSGPCLGWNFCSLLLLSMKNMLFSFCPMTFSKSTISMWFVFILNILVLFVCSLLKLKTDTVMRMMEIAINKRGCEICEMKENI